MKKIFWLSLTGIFFLPSCDNKSKGPDVSAIKVNVILERFEKDFFEMDTLNLSQSLDKLYRKYPGFYPDFMGAILGVNGADTSIETQDVAKEFYRTYRSFNDSLLKKYRSTASIEKEITNGLQHVKYYFPGYKIPGLITFLGPLDAPGVALTRSYIAIGLHQFAGKNFSAYQEAAVQRLYPLYISRRFDEEYIAANCMKVIIDELFPDQSNGKPLIEQMIEKGKQWYLLDKFLPGSPDSVKTGYTQKQLEWCNRNEGEIWSIIIKNEDLNSINPTVIQSYIGEAPFTQGFSQENSPGNLGQWIGWQIVKKYAEKNPSLQPGDIMRTNARKILDEAKYKPR
jgi:hypothetical protein